ncbi:tripartite tricarboxylate transporter substrate binding protein [Candidimonas sp. SYP-B2681]|nr:tripartite tricarboxylate transporter substrate binding protein [Candidimonas sp. SYP-B2681]
MTTLRKLLASLFVVTTATTVHAEAVQTWPRQPITIVVPFAAGGGTDSIAREFALELGKELGQAVVVENRGGGGGSIGASRVAQAKPDGYTLLFATSTFATNSAWEKSTAYDPKTSFTPIALLGTGPLMLVANKELGVKTTADLLKKAKDEPNSINYCSAGPGSINHLSGALFQQLGKVDITHVPYRGSGPATLDLLAGRVQIFFSTMPTMLENVKADKVLLLAVTTKERSSLFPNVATLDEAGIPGFDISTWWGVLGPANMPASIVEKLNAVTNKITGEQLVRNRLASEGATVFKGSPGDFEQKLFDELAMWEKVVGAIEQR